MVSLRWLNKRLSTVTDQVLNAKWAAIQAGDGEKLFHIEAGATIAEVNAAVQARGLALSTLGRSNGQSLAGAPSTSTHGGDIELPTLASPDLSCAQRNGR
jgi:FAD/FMN-containing dehydrogenase